MILVSMLAGCRCSGRLAVAARSPRFDFIPGWIWASSFDFLVCRPFIWIRAHLPRYRCDQIMRWAGRCSFP